MNTRECVSAWRFSTAVAGRDKKPTLPPLLMLFRTERDLVCPHQASRCSRCNTASSHPASPLPLTMCFLPSTDLITPIQALCSLKAGLRLHAVLRSLVWKSSPLQTVQDRATQEFSAKRDLKCILFTLSVLPSSPAQSQHDTKHWFEKALNYKWPKKKISCHRILSQLPSANEDLYITILSIFHSIIYNPVSSS